ARFLFAAFLSAVVWVGVAMAAGAMFRPQIEATIAWIAEHAVLAALGLGALMGAYVSWKGMQRWRIARSVEGAKISVEELRRELFGESPPLVVDVGSRLTHGARPHLPGALMLDLDAITRHPFPARPLVFYCACPNEESARRAAQIAIARGF